MHASNPLNINSLHSFCLCRQNLAAQLGYTYILERGKGDVRALDEELHLELLRDLGLGVRGLLIYFDF